MADLRQRSLAAIAGAAAAAALISIVPKFEGTVLVAKPDPVGIVTACMGDTKDVRLGQRFTPQECEQRLEARLAETAQGVDRCTPLAPMAWYQRVAFVDFAYNAGVRAYCGSTMAKKVKANDYAGACAELSRWTYASGRQLPGLVKRRAIERAMCEGKTQ
ncbi:lysozyme [Paraburkholderia sp. BCC1885]|uniref:lysozyme n=1 Tax=Paraburkholderia sp. BCC1885 TaxID=2562669 RepID=UPI0011844E93|nr:lysozyme [Paraburkholderia sp. BCC1885]